jgi:hypothetical protein
MGDIILSRGGSWYHPVGQGRHSLTLLLTPTPVSTRSPASLSLSQHLHSHLGFRMGSKQPAPCGVGTQRPSCSGQTREKDLWAEEWGWGMSPSPQAK